MLLIVAVLVVFLGGTFSANTKQQTETKTTEELIPKLYYTFVKMHANWTYKLIWDERIESDALHEARQRYNTSANLKIRRRKVFIKGDTTPLATKVEEALVNPFMRAEKFLRRLPWYTHYACNGMYDTKGAHDVLTVACLYRDIDPTRPSYWKAVNKIAD